MKVACRVCVRTGEERLWIEREAVVDGRRGEDERREGAGSFPILGGVCLLRGKES